MVIIPRRRVVRPEECFCLAVAQRVADQFKIRVRCSGIRIRHLLAGRRRDRDADCHLNRGLVQVGIVVTVEKCVEVVNVRLRRRRVRLRRFRGRWPRAGWLFDGVGVGTETVGDLPHAGVRRVVAVDYSCRSVFRDVAAATYDFPNFIILGVFLIQ